jgi:hypothetical protein
MRRFTVLPLALLLALVLAAPVSAGANVSNRSGTFDQAYGGWSAYDEENDISTYGEVYVAQEAGRGGFVEYLYEESGTYIDCSTGLPAKGAATVTPKDTTGGDYGFKGTQTSGWGDATLTLGRKLSGATASGQIYAETYAVDGCAGDYVLVDNGTEALSLVLAGSGPIATFKSSSSIKIPGVLKGHSSYSGDQRAAAGTVAFGRGSRALDGQIAHVTWRDHCSGAC